MNIEKTIDILRILSTFVVSAGWWQVSAKWVRWSYENGLEIYSKMTKRFYIPFEAKRFWDQEGFQWMKWPIIKITQMNTTRILGILETGLDFAVAYFSGGTYFIPGMVFAFATAVSCYGVVQEKHYDQWFDNMHKECDRLGSESVEYRQKKTNKDRIFEKKEAWEKVSIWNAVKRTYAIYGPETSLDLVFIAVGRLAGASWFSLLKTPFVSNVLCNILMVEEETGREYNLERINLRKAYYSKAIEDAGYMKAGEGSHSNFRWCKLIESSNTRKDSSRQTIHVI